MTWRRPFDSFFHIHFQKLKERIRRQSSRSENQSWKPIPYRTYSQTKQLNKLRQVLAVQEISLKFLPVRTREEHFSFLFLFCSTAQEFSLIRYKSRRKLIIESELQPIRRERNGLEIGRTQTPPLKNLLADKGFLLSSTPKKGIWVSNRIELLSLVPSTSKGLWFFLLISRAANHIWVNHFKGSSKPIPRSEKKKKSDPRTDSPTPYRIERFPRNHTKRKSPSPRGKADTDRLHLKEGS